MKHFSNRIRGLNSVATAYRLAYEAYGTRNISAKQVTLMTFLYGFRRSGVCLWTTNSRPTFRRKDDRLKMEAI